METKVAVFPVALVVKNLPARFNPWVGKIPWRREWLPTPVFLLNPGGLWPIGSQSVRHDLAHTRGCCLCVCPGGDRGGLGEGSTQVWLQSPLPPLLAG